MHQQYAKKEIRDILLLGFVHALFGFAGNVVKKGLGAVIELLGLRNNNLLLFLNLSLISLSNLLGQFILVELGVRGLKVEIRGRDSGGTGVVHMTMSTATAATASTTVVVRVEQVATHTGETVRELGLVVVLNSAICRILGHIELADLLGEDLDRLAQFLRLSLGGRTNGWGSGLNGLRIRLFLLIGLFLCWLGLARGGALRLLL